MSRLITLYSKFKRIPNKVMILGLRGSLGRATKENSQKLVNSLASGSKQKSPEDELSHYLNPLRNECLESFKDAHKAKNLKVLFHLPSIYATGMRSVYLNWMASLNYMGVGAEAVEFEESLSEKLSEFSPDLFVSVDHQLFLNSADWATLKDYREKADLQIALLAHDESESTDNYSNEKRLALAKSRKIDFFFSFRSRDYVQRIFPHLTADYKVLSIPFGANPIKDYYIPCEKTFDWNFLGSSNPDKAPRMARYFKGIFKGYSGVLVGPGWGNDIPLSLEGKYHSGFYSSAKISLNLHLQEQVDRSCETNERVYSLAAAGNFQLLDKPKALGEVFPDPSHVAAVDSPSEYLEAFKHYLHAPKEREVMIKHGFDAVYRGGHTLFHRMETLIEQIQLCEGKK